MTHTYGDSEIYIFFLLFLTRDLIFYVFEILILFSTNINAMIVFHPVAIRLATRLDGCSEKSEKQR